jgi:hypothetical protein
MRCVKWGEKFGKNISKGVDPCGPGGLGSPRRAAPSAARETGVDRDSSSTKMDPIGFLVPSKQDLSQIMARPTVVGVVASGSRGLPYECLKQALGQKSRVKRKRLNCVLRA